MRRYVSEMQGLRVCDGDDGVRWEGMRGQRRASDPLCESCDCRFIYSGRYSIVSPNLGFISLRK